MRWIYEEKKNTSQITSQYVKPFRAIQSLNDLIWFFFSIWFLRIINAYQCFFTLNILFDEVDKGLVVTPVENKHCTKKR